jgi:glycosyltransferase involved in cell wall biosynthesis
VRSADGSIDVRPRPALTVVIATRDRPQWLARCLDALRVEGRDGTSAVSEVIVVDSASRQPAVRGVADAYGVRCERVDLPGASRARNRGWRAATTDYVAFLDDDVLVCPGWSQALVGALAPQGEGDAPAFVTGRVALPPDSGDGGWAFALVDHAAGRRLDAATPGVLGGSGNLLVSRGALEAVGGFDERLGPGCWLSAGEDLDLLDRLVERGFSGRFAAVAVVLCEQWRGAGARRQLAFAYGKGMGARFAALLRRCPRRAVQRRGEFLRLRGLRTAARELAARRRDGGGDAGPNGSSPRRDLREPLLWRLGVLVGFAAALRLPPWTAARQASP